MELSHLGNASRFYFRWPFCLAVLLLSFLSSQAWALSKTFQTAKGTRILLNAQNLDSDLDRRITELSGQVQILYDQQFLKCDRAVINESTQVIELYGNLVINSPQAYIEGDQATLNLKDDTGIIMSGFIKSGQVIFEGRIIRKTGPDQYEAETGYYTACTTCPPAWAFRGSRIRAEIGGYAYIKNSVLEFGKVPVFWLPYLVVPLKSERQTGLLIPSLEFKGGDDVAVTSQFFWAISRSQDATFALKNYTKRGLKGLINYRYMLSDLSYGELDTGFIRDRAYAQDTNLRSLGTIPNEDRWFFTYSHQYTLPHDFIQKTHLNFVSDLRYPRDYSDEISGQGEPALDNRVSLTKNTDLLHNSLDVSYYINQLKAKPTAENRDAVHRWPELRFAIAENNLFNTDALVNFKIDYVNFSREDFAFDDAQTVTNLSTGQTYRIYDSNRTLQPSSSATQTVDGTGGVFDPNHDVIRAGQRLSVQPEISYPFHLGRYIEILPHAQFRHTQYSFNVTAPESQNFDPAPYQQYLRGRISARTRFYRIYGQPADDVPPGLPTTQNLAEIDSQPSKPDEVSPVEHPNLLRHEIEPEVIFSGVPYLHTTSNPFFGQDAQLPSFLDNQPVSESDFQSSRRLQFDYNDLVTNRNTATFVLSNRLVSKTWEGNQSSYKQIALFKLAQNYDFDEAKKTSGPRFPWSDIYALIDVRLGYFETNTVFRYYPYHNVTNTSSRIRTTNKRGDYIQLTFSEKYSLINQNLDDVLRERQEDLGIGAGFNVKYLTFAGEVATRPVRYWPIKLSVKSWSTNMVIKPPGNCWGISLKFQQDIGANAQVFKIDFDYKFGGENT